MGRAIRDSVLRMARRPRWRIRDVLDLEAALEADAGRDDGELAARDRAIFREDVRGGAHDAAGKMRLWLGARRRMDGKEFSAGDVYASTMGAMGWGLILAGLAIGAGLAGSQLVFAGDRLISVTAFFSVTVLWQLIVLLVLAGVILFRRRPVGGVIGWALGRGLAAVGRAKAAAWGGLDGTGRMKFAAVLGAVRAKRAVYGDVMIWPVVTLTQTFAVAVNVGILAATLWSVGASNRAFGWEETALQWSPETMLKIVSVISWPWSWLASAHPTLVEIAGSRIAVLGNVENVPDAVVSWWPFLVYAVAFYGLLPRVILLTASVVFERRTLGGIEFRHAECARVLRRMEPVVVAGEAGPAKEAVAGRLESAETGLGAVDVVLVAREMVAEARDAAVARLGWGESERREVEIDCAEANAAEFGRLNGESGAVAVLVEGGRPPVKAMLEFLRKLRDSVAERAEVMVVVVAEEGAAFDYAEAWADAVAGLGDAFMRVERA